MKTQEQHTTTINPGSIKETTLLLGDCLDKLKELDDNSIDSIVSDPPYGLSFMGKKWDYDVPSQAIWEECMRVLKPGGHLLSFAGSRTYHRMAVRIEDAGFEIRDQIMWIYGSGFPKSHNIGKALDKNNGNNNLVSEVADKLKEARESRGISKTEADKLFCDGTTNYSWLEGRKGGVRLPEDDLFQKIVDEWPELKPYQQKVKSANREVIGQYEGDAGGLGGERLGDKGGDITIAATDEAKEWNGWGTALKPAHEPIVMARKPIVGTVANNVLEYGVGGINIDGCRVSTDDKLTRPNVNGFNKEALYSNFNNNGSEENGKYDDRGSVEGRFPANIILDEEAGKILDEQSGISKSPKPYKYNGTKDRSNSITKGFGVGYTDHENEYGDSGGASRFFYKPKNEIWEQQSNVSTAQMSLYQQEQVEDFVVNLVAIQDNQEDKQLGNMILPFMNEMRKVLNQTSEANIKQMMYIGEKCVQELTHIIMERLKNNPAKYVEIQKLINTTTIIQNLLITDGFVESITSNIILKNMVLGEADSLTRFKYCPKASKKDRDEGLEVEAKVIKGRDEGQDKMAVAYKARPTERQNIHPTVKPTDLMQYLIRLVTPKGGIVLDPFMGSGSTGKAAIKEGMIFVGIEREDEYYQIAKQRIGYEIDKNEPKHNFW